MVPIHAFMAAGMVWRRSVPHSVLDAVSIGEKTVLLGRPVFDDLVDGGDPTALRLWPAALPLACRLHGHILPALRRAKGRPLRLLELGAGRGLVGLSVAALDDDDCIEEEANRATHGALPHRAPCTRCTADPTHHEWHRWW